ncbi:class I SAM-dependent methyltransferase [Pseudonocardia sp. KRD291]|uniref:class I SAM-dependent methyltransferase n=1 Tax=Pseudonocardia sp. KRD291 TaxID=2792007 RepID=UPI001C49DF06|nr:methyltransferase domain-containing protein [Pseudonocardia sp. KRD291]MBW0101114.1 methyltransferase domain-containing protein [Pseudonocardia sp. KRD291]
MGDTLLFVRQFLRSPTTIGAVAPSSAYLARRIAADVPESGDPVVLELGPGSGAFTGEIRRRLGGRGRHVAVEVNPSMAAALRSRHPGVEVIEGDAADTAGLLRAVGVTRVDLVVSGLPWAVFPGPKQDAILDSVVAAMPPDGRFATFAYSHATVLPPAVRFRRRLEERFESVGSGATEWRNLPPARILHAARPRAGATSGPSV